MRSVQSAVDIKPFIRLHLISFKLDAREEPEIPRSSDPKISPLTGSKPVSKLSSSSFYSVNNTAFCLYILSTHPKIVSSPVFRYTCIISDS